VTEEVVEEFLYPIMTTVYPFPESSILPTMNPQMYTNSKHELRRHNDVEESFLGKCYSHNEKEQEEKPQQHSGDGVRGWSGNYISISRSSEHELSGWWWDDISLWSLWWSVALTHEYNDITRKYYKVSHNHRTPNNKTVAIAI